MLSDPLCIHVGKVRASSLNVFDTMSQISAGFEIQLIDLRQSKCEWLQMDALHSRRPQINKCVSCVCVTYSDVDTRI